MASKSRHFLSGLAVVAALVCALPAAVGFGAPPTEALPIFQVNRTIKSDRLAVPRSSVVNKTPVQSPAQPDRIPERDEARKLMDGCEPVFSPVTMPTMAHVAGRCVG